MLIVLLKALVAVVKDIAAFGHRPVHKSLVILVIHYHALLLLQLFDVLEAEHLLQVHPQSDLHPKLIVSMSHCIVEANEYENKSEDDGAKVVPDLLYDLHFLL